MVRKRSLLYSKTKRCRDRQKRRETYLKTLKNTVVLSCPICPKQLISNRSLWYHMVREHPKHPKKMPKLKYDTDEVNRLTNVSRSPHHDQQHEPGRILRANPRFEDPKCVKPAIITITKDHLAQIKQVAAHVCTLCGKRFLFARFLNKHISEQHGIGNMESTSEAMTDGRRRPESTSETALSAITVQNYEETSDVKPDIDAIPTFADGSSDVPGTSRIVTAPGAVVDKGISSAITQNCVETTDVKPDVHTILMVEDGSNDVPGPSRVVVDRAEIGISSAITVQNCLEASEVKPVMDAICSVCSQVCKEVRGLVSHVRSAHSMVVCLLCHRTFKDKDEVNIHREKIHGLITRVKRTYPMTACSLCPRMFKHSRAVTIHKTRFHKIRPSQLSTSVDEELNEEVDPDHATATATTSVQGSEGMSCSQCSEVFKNEAGVAIHMAKAHRNKNEDGLAIHMAKAHVKKSRVTCSVCDKVCKSEEGLVFHLKVKHSLAGCSLCHGLFKNKGAVNIHKARIHKIFCPSRLSTSVDEELGSEGMSCSQCSEVFKNEAGVAIHMAKAHRNKNEAGLATHMEEAHLNNSTVTCSVCNKVCKKEGLITHVQRTHSMAACSLCHRVFKHKGAVHIHKARIHKIFCPSRLSTSVEEELNEEVDPDHATATATTSVQGSEGMSCSQCSEVFKNEVGVAIHMAKAHRNKNEDGLATHMEEAHLNKSTVTSCSVCNNMVCKKEGLITHVQKTHSMAACSLCHRVFMHKGAVHIHKARIHKIFCPSRLSTSVDEELNEEVQEVKLN